MQKYLTVKIDLEDLPFGYSEVELADLLHQFVVGTLLPAKDIIKYDRDELMIDVHDHYSSRHDACMYCYENLAQDGRN
jgi:hypothetical protein